MTVGSPAKLIIQFMIPMCLGNLFQQFYNVVDSIVAGQFLGVQALAAIGSTGALMFFVIGWLNGLTSGFAIMVDQSFGAKQYDRMRHYVAMSIYLSIAFALVMTIGFSIANEPILRMMNYSDEIMPAVKGYMGIIYMGLLVTVAYDALSAFTCIRRFPFPTVLPHDFRCDQCNIRHRIHRSNRNGSRRMRLCHCNRHRQSPPSSALFTSAKSFRSFA